MASPNAETVFDALRRAHERDYEGASHHFQPDAVWINTPAFPGPRTCTGPEEIMEFWRTLYESFEDGGGFELVDAAERGDRVAVSLHSWGRGVTSGTPIDIRWGCVAELRDGLIARAEIHGDYQKALEALDAA
jgi:ketosteroid isomerase-like protein